MEIERKSLALADVSLKFDDADEGTFSGYASVFNGVDAYGDTILPGAYSPALKAMRKEKRTPKMFVNHASWEIPVGKWIDYSEDDKGLFVRGQLTLAIQQAQALQAAMKHGTIDGISVGIRIDPKGYTLSEDDDGNSIRTIKRIADLPEISVVTFPADRAARVDLSSVKSALGEACTWKDVETLLRDAGGFSRGAAAALLSRIRELMRSESAAASEGDVNTDELTKHLRDALLVQTVIASDLRSLAANVNTK